MEGGASIWGGGDYSLILVKLKEIKLKEVKLNPFTPTNDQDRISPYNIKQAGDENKEECQLWDY